MKPNGSSTGPEGSEAIPQKFSLSQEQVDACKKLGKFLTGELGPDESDAIENKISEQDELYYPLWNNRNWFSQNLLQLLKSEEE